MLHCKIQSMFTSSEKLVMRCKHQNVLVYKSCTMIKVFCGHNIVLNLCMYLVCIDMFLQKGLPRFTFFLILPYIDLYYWCLFGKVTALFWDFKIRCFFFSIRFSLAPCEQKSLSFSWSALSWCHGTISVLSGISAVCGRGGSDVPPTAPAAALLTAVSPHLPPPFPTAATTVPASSPCPSSPRCCPLQSPGQPAHPIVSWPASD